MEKKPEAESKRRNKLFIKTVVAIGALVVAISTLISERAKMVTEDQEAEAPAAAAVSAANNDAGPEEATAVGDADAGTSDGGEITEEISPAELRAQACSDFMDAINDPNVIVYDALQRP